MLRQGSPADAGCRSTQLPGFNGAPEREISIKGPLRFSPQAINRRATAPDGRIVFTGVSVSLWHWQAAILDPRTGAEEVLPGGEAADTDASWTHDGKVWIVGDDLESTMWRYRPAQIRR